MLPAVDVHPQVEPGRSPAGGPAFPIADRDSRVGLVTRRICPYLSIDGAAWRSAYPQKDHRCGAITPPALLAVDKQRRLCLTDAHVSCATYLTARHLPLDREPLGGTGEDGPGAAEVLASEAGVTRWSLVRTVPVVLDHSRVTIRVGRPPVSRSLAQVVLGGLLVLAVSAVVLSRFTGQANPATAGDLSPSPSTIATTAASPTIRPTPTLRPTPSPSVTPATPEPSFRTYTVKSGDFLIGIANRFGTTVKAIMDLNGISDPSRLTIGLELKIPN
jgi:LysM repeat protein